MRSIALFTMPADLDGPLPEGAIAPTFSFARLITELMRHAPRGGLPLPDLEQALGVIAAVRKAEADKTALLLEEAQWQYLLRRVNEGEWALVDPVIPALVRAIREAPQVDVAATVPDAEASKLQAMAAQHS